MKYTFNASMRGAGILKATHGTEQSGLSARFVADGICLEVQSLWLNGVPMFQVALSEKPGADCRYVKMFTKEML
jgi:hypothetical protein